MVPTYILAYPVPYVNPRIPAPDLTSRRIMCGVAVIVSLDRVGLQLMR